MQPLEKEILQLIRLEQLTQTGEKILLGVSGGPDSMALLHVLAKLAPLLDITPAAAYVNHGLRPDEAPAERKLVESAAADLGIAFFTGSIDVKGLAAELRISTEHAARILRYDYLGKTAAKWGAAKIGVAHTADDQAEEILLRLIRGTARKGLSGMKTIRDGRLMRPFLRTAKARLLSYLKENSIHYHHDSSNMADAYLRNRVRNDLLPFLAAHYNPNIRQTLRRTAEILQDEEALLEQLTDGAFAEVVTTAGQIPDKSGPGSPMTTACQLGELTIDIKLFVREHRAVQRRLLEKCCWFMGCAPQSLQIEQLLKLAIKNNPGTGIHLADGLRTIIENNQLLFAYPAGRGPFRGNLRPGDGAEFPETSIPTPGTYEFPQLGKKLVLENNRDRITGPEGIQPTGEYLDAALFSFPLTLRGPRPGDRFRPLGAPGSKKLGDFLGEQKVGLEVRGLVPVLCEGEAILALPGLQIDHRYRITDNTRRLIRISWEDY